MGSNQVDGCNTSLSLDVLGFTTNKKSEKAISCMSLKFDHVYPALSLGRLDQGFSLSPGSSSYPNNNYSNSMKRSMDQEKDIEVDKVSYRMSTEEDEEEEENEASPRKKLRLTKDQSAILEDSFKQHSTLNPQQKQALAKRLNLRPRQVEVWFQNRRARTKLKQTEMEFEVLKKCCESLNEENKRLQKEVQQLKSLKLSSSAAVYMQMPAPTLSMCPSCERFISTATSPGAPGAPGVAPPAPDFLNLTATKPSQAFFTHPSAAC